MPRHSSQELFSTGRIFCYEIDINSQKVPRGTLIVTIVQLINHQSALKKDEAGLIEAAFKWFYLKQTPSVLRQLLCSTQADTSSLNGYIKMFHVEQIDCFLR